MPNKGENNKEKQGKLGFVATWALAAGGMVGGGIYTALGVVIAVAAQWAWLSFAIARYFNYEATVLEYGEPTP